MDSWLHGCLTNWLVWLWATFMSVWLPSYSLLLMAGRLLLLISFPWPTDPFWAIRLREFSRGFHKRKPNFRTVGKIFFPSPKNFNASIIYLLPKQKRIRMFSFKKIALTMIFNVHCLSAHIYLPSCARIKRKNLLPAQRDNWHPCHGFLLLLLVLAGDLKKHSHIIQFPLIFLILCALLLSVR